MIERPILFQPAMVRAMFARRKTQTRRTIKPAWLPDVPLDHIEIVDPKGTVSYRRPPGHLDVAEAQATLGYTVRTVRDGLLLRCPYGKPGDQLWVRESWATEGRWNTTPPRDIRKTAPLWYPATEKALWDTSASRVRPGIHMPRWASRLNLTVTGVRLEHLCDISIEDAVAEGAEPRLCIDAPYGPLRMYSMDWDGKPAISHEYGLNSPQAAFWNYLEVLNGGKYWNCNGKPLLYDLNPLLYVVEFEVQQ